jgi:cyclopropane fatty-acyl-phospholipid synthase-like methyltransferase
LSNPRPLRPAGSRKNIEEHYDAGNAMYKLFLDETMTYSSGLYLSAKDTLYDSQINKIDALIKKAGITAADSVLEIGCGWGGFGIRAAQTTGCRWTGITVSKEQLAEATERVAAAGVQVRGCALSRVCGWGGGGRMWKGRCGAACRCR